MRRLLNIAAAAVVAACLSCSSSPEDAASRGNNVPGGNRPLLPAPSDALDAAPNGSIAMPSLPQDSGSWGKSESDTWRQAYGFLFGLECIEVSDDPLFVPLATYLSGSVPDGLAPHSSIALVGDGDRSRWAIYQLPKQGGGFVLRSLTPVLSGYGSEIYLLLSNYASGAWEPLMSLQAPESWDRPTAPVISPEQGFGDYTNASGYCYLAVYGTQGVTIADGFFIEADTSIELATPTGLTFQGNADGSTTFAWDSYSSVHADKLVLFSYLNPFKSPAKQASQGSPVYPFACAVRPLSATTWTMTDSIPAGESFFLEAVAVSHGLYSARSNVVLPSGP